MVGTIQELAARLWGMPDWIHVTSVVMESAEGTLVIDRPLAEYVDLPTPEEPFTLHIRLESRHTPTASID